MSIPTLVPYSQTPISPISLAQESAGSLSKGPEESKGPEKQHAPNTNDKHLGNWDRLTLSRQALELVKKLQVRDREVKAHEHAHMAAGGPYVRGGPSYTYQTGPDGKRYAVGGEVQIDTSPEKDPEDTIRKMETVKRAALAPSRPSGQDRLVAARASMEEQKARMELMKEEMNEASQDDKTGSQPEEVTGSKDI